MEPCSTPEHLRQFLDERLAAADAEAVARHLEACAACRQALDQLSADADSQNWRRLRAAAPRTGDEPRPGFLRRLGDVLAPGSWLARSTLHYNPPPGPAKPGEGFKAPPGYEILERRGRGGIGVVYKARDLRLKRVVALKVLLTGAEAGGEERARLRAEAEAVARLEHPNIVQIHEIGEHDGCPFLVLEFVEGGTLAEQAGATPQPPSAAAGLVEVVARAVHYAHEHGVVHRDLKPANILLHKPEVRGQRSEVREQKSDGGGAGSAAPCPLTSDLCPKITDFGLAKRLDEASQTQTGQVLGTPGYMAPEQARGQNKEVGPAADVYALGAILYQLLTGRPPFQGVTPVETIMQVLHEEPVPPRRLQPKVPADLETVCLKCLAKEPRQRYASAADLAEDLCRFQAGESIRARRVGVVGQSWRWCRRNPVPAGLLAALAAALVAGTAGVTWGYLGAEAARERETLARRREAEQRDLAELRRYYSRVALAERQWQANNVAQADYLLDQCLPEEGRPDRRGWEWYYLKRLCHSDLATVLAHGTAVSGLAVSPDGKYVASAAGDRGYRHNTRTTPGELTLWDAETFRKIGDLAGHRGRVDGVAFDRAGARLASVSADDTVRLWAVPSREPLGTFPIAIHGHWRGASAAFSPGGEALAVPAVRELRLLDPATGAVTSALPTDTKWSWCGPCAWSPDGALLAMSGATPDGAVASALVVWDAVSRRELYRRPLPSFAAAFSPDSRLLATTRDRDVILLDARKGTEALTLHGHDGLVYGLAWSPDGGFLASCGADQTVRVWEVRAGREEWELPAGREHRVLRGHTATVHRVAFCPDGRRLVAGDDAGVLKMWDVDHDQRWLELPSTRNDKGVAFTADGGQVRAVREGGFRGWDLATGRTAFDRRADLGRRPEWPLRSTAISPDGRLAAAPDPKEPATVRVWDVETGEAVLALNGHRTGVRSLAFSPDGRRLASASGEKDATEPRELFVWQLPERGGGEPSRVELPCEAPVQSLAFSADGRRLVAGERGTQVPNEGPQSDWPWVDGHISVWEVTTGRRLNRWLAHTRGVQSVAYDPAGRWVASAGRNPDQAVRLWDAETGGLLHDLRGPTWLTCVAFHPDGTRLAAVGYQGMVHLWDPATGLDVLTLRGPNPHIPEGGAYDTQVAFSHDGTRLAVNSWTGSVCVFDARPLTGR